MVVLNYPPVPTWAEIPNAATTLATHQTLGRREGACKSLIALNPPPPSLGTRQATHCDGPSPEHSQQSHHLRSLPSLAPDFTWRGVPKNVVNSGAAGAY